MERKTKTPEEVIYAIDCCYPEQDQPSECAHCPYSESERCYFDLVADAQALLLNATDHRDRNTRPDGELNEVGKMYMKGAEALAAAIQALKAQDVTELERPESRGAKLLDTLCEAVCNSQNQYDRDIAASLIQAWRAGRVDTDPLVTALLAPKLVWAESRHYGLEDKLYAAMLKMMVPDVCPGACQSTPDEEEQANDQD